MKYRRKQTVGNIQFIVESNFKSGKAASAKDKLTNIMITKANEVLRAAYKSKVPMMQN